MDKLCMTLGWLVGRRIAGQRKIAGKEPTAYLYNGTKLPPLPQWDREKYPYALIAYGGSGLVGAKNYQLTCSGAPFVWESDYGLSAPTAGYAYSLYYDGNGDWGKVYESASAASANTGTDRTAVWANHDVYLTGGALHLAASEPVPVYA